MPFSVVGVLDRQRVEPWLRVGQQRVVRCDRLLHQHRHAPAVGDRVVQHQQQPRATATLVDQHSAHERAAKHVKRHARLRAQCRRDVGPHALKVRIGSGGGACAARRRQRAVRRIQPQQRHRKRPLRQQHLVLLVA
eukprot:144393-Chlamydomonas_euryale.AAC.6